MTIHFSEHDRNFGSQTDVAAFPAAASSKYHRIGKRALDVVLVLLVLPIVLPFIALCAAAIWLRDRGSPFYSQKRVGLGGRTFRMWKLRTMVRDADAALIAHLDANPLARIEWARKQKLRIDPRVTSIGRVLRRYSLDEFPQLWNVLKGDMSIVGPRPMMPEQTALYHGAAYYSLRPGLTGPWQISDRNECNFSGRVRHDLWYFHNLGFVTDLRMIFATFSVLVRGTGC